MANVGYRVKKEKTIAEQLGVKTFPFKIYNDDNKLVYCENEKGYWGKTHYDDKGHNVYFENSKGFWCKSIFNEKGLEIYCETSGGYWCVSEYDEHGILRYYKNSDGKVNGHHLQKTAVRLTREQIAKQFKLPVNRIKIS
jgi:hypothetical protein